MSIYIGTLAAVSNRADWRFGVELIDPDTLLGVDLTGATIKIAIRAQDQSTPMLRASNSDGHITVTGLGTISVAFPPSEMATLIPGSYNLGMTLKLADNITRQVMAVSLPVIEGVVDI